MYIHQYWKWPFLVTLLWIFFIGFLKRQFLYRNRQGINTGFVVDRDSNFTSCFFYLFQERKNQAADTTHRISTPYVMQPGSAPYTRLDLCCSKHSHVTNLSARELPYLVNDRISNDFSHEGLGRNPIDYYGTTEAIHKPRHHGLKAAKSCDLLTNITLSGRI